MSNVITVETARKQGITAEKLWNCSAWNRDRAFHSEMAAKETKMDKDQRAHKYYTSEAERFTNQARRIELVAASI